MLVQLKPGGTRPPLFALTAGDGNVVGFEPLAKHLARRAAAPRAAAARPRRLHDAGPRDRGDGRPLRRRDRGRPAARPLPPGRPLQRRHRRLRDRPAAAPRRRGGAAAGRARFATPRWRRGPSWQRGSRATTSPRRRGCAPASATNRCPSAAPAAQRCAPGCGSRSPPTSPATPTRSGTGERTCESDGPTRSAPTPTLSRPGSGTTARRNAA